MARDSQDKILRKLIAELDELLADYLHLAQDVDGKVDPVRRKRFKKVSGLLFRYKMWQSTR